MCKRNGTLGFTLRKELHLDDGHVVSALVQEPCTTDGRIAVGDQIVQVNFSNLKKLILAIAI